MSRHSLLASLFGWTSKPWKRSILSWTMVAVLIVSTSTLLQVSPIEASTSYTVHSPIVIIGDSTFTAQNGVTSGRGTHSDPYRIEGWSIASLYGQAAIRIESTTAYFLIIHVQLLNAQPGVYLTGVSNGRVENSTLMNSDFGIRIESSTNITISGNNISGSYDGVYASDILSAPQTTGVTITNNTFVNSGAVIDSSQSQASHLNITGNTFFSGRISTSAYGAIVARNRITPSSPSSGAALTVDGNNSIVSGNTVSGGDIQISGSGTIVTSNTAERIFLSATTITLTNNALTKALRISPYPFFTTPPYYDSHVMTGNTVDGKPLYYFARCSGASIDGASAGEVIVASCRNVTVANLRLSGVDEGIVLDYVHQATVVANNLSGIFGGLDVTGSSDVQILNNHLNGTGVSIINTDNVTLRSNFASGGGPFAMLRIWGGNGISVLNNTLEAKGGTALNLADVVNALLTGNIVSGSRNGIVVDGANGLNITANNLLRNEVGLTFNPGNLNGVFNSAIYHNNFVDNSKYQAAYLGPVTAAFDYGYPAGGNYWSEYRAVDNCSGPLQNICSGPDGIGDKPYSGIWELQYFLAQPPGNLTDQYPLVSPYGSFSWDTSAPSWTSDSRLTISVVNSTSLTLKWTGAMDDSWVSGYRAYQDNTLLASLPRYVQSFTISHLSPGTTHVFKVEAGDPAQNWSTDGPSATTTLPQPGNTPSTSKPLLTMSWWMEHWYLGILTAGLGGMAAAGILLVRRKKA